MEQTGVARRRLIGRPNRAPPTRNPTFQDRRSPMAAHGVSDRTGATAPGAARVARHDATTETKPAFKTTELIAYVAAVAGVLIAALIVDEANAGGLGAKQAWLYVTILTVGYMISRGLAKSGSYEHDHDPRTGSGDR
jgi:hypothetical protein